MIRMKFLFIGVVVCMNAFGADIKYPVSAIPESLKKDVNSVVREDDVTFKIVSQRSAVETGHWVVTILNSGGSELAEWAMSYDKLRKVTALRAAVYDKDGRLLKRVKSGEFKDESAFDGMYSDNRSKSVDLRLNTYPYTVEIEYELEYKFLFYIPSMTFIPDEKVSVQRARYALEYPDGLQPRYRVQNVKQSPVESKTPGGLNQISWTLTDLAPVSIEAMGPRFSQQVPRILAGPSRFEFDGYVGSMDTWQGFGKWIGLLNRDRKNLPEATKLKVRELVAKQNSREDKIRALYSYMQSRTRYVSIQLGIGGFQPFEAAVVDQNGYGDCKALSNYMVALLDAADIKSHYVLINAGRNAPALVEDFPSSQFNHAVVAVPNGADTVWLECTSQVNPFGFAGNFTGNRKALLITDEGAQIVRTTSYKERENAQTTRATVNIQESGNATATVSTRYQGLQYENGGLSSALGNNYDEQKKWILKNTEIPTFDVKSFNMRDNKERIPFADVNLNLVLNRYASVSGKRLFMTPNLMNRWTYIPERTEARKSPIVMNMAYTDIDTIEFELPESLYPEFLPEPMIHRSRFGEYEASVKLDAGKLVYRRRIVIYKGEYPASTYPELVDFMKNLSRSDNMKMVFLNKT